MSLMGELSLLIVVYLVKRAPLFEDKIQSFLA